MSSLTKNLGLFMYNAADAADAERPFNMDEALNDNWKKIDEAFGAGGSKYVLIFAAANWSGAAAPFTMSIPAATHGAGKDPSADIYRLSGSIYRKTWNYPGSGLACEVDANGNITLKSDEKFGGKLIVL